MNRIAKPSYVGALGFDTVARISSLEARRLAAWGMRFAVRYLGALASDEVDALLDAGIAVMPVTYGGAFDGAAAVVNCLKAGIAKGTTVWLDVEGQKGDPAILIAKINAWAAAVKNAGFEPGLYVGAGALLTGEELYKLAVVRYWNSLSREVDRNGHIAEPTCGWCMHQLYPSVAVAGILVDCDVVQQDFRGRVPSWTTRAAVDTEADTLRELPVK